MTVADSNRARATHGHAKRGARSVEYVAWRSIKDRCSDDGDLAKYYKNRGIKVCSRWANSFENFLADMGNRPSPLHSVDRINNNKGYTPQNCRWATKKQQMRNRINTQKIRFNGKVVPLRDVADQAGLNYETLRYRIRTKWPIDRLLSAPTAKKVNV